jgi:hypothetical protein
MMKKKKSLLLEMIAFSTVDGHLHKKEYEFLFYCQSIEHRKGDLTFHQELPKLPIKNEFQRIQQFYRLALLMHRDGILHIKEAEAIKQTAIRMGLNPEATKRVLKKWKMRPM